MEITQKLSYLPSDVQEKIFLKLPIKSILRFKTLSKYYHSLFSGHEFRSRYFTSSSLVFGPEKRSDGNFFYAFTDLEDDDINGGNHKNMISVNRQEPQLLGCFNGLVALYNGQDELVLWNPSTRNRKFVRVSFHVDFWNPNLCGLCYNAMNNEYMVFLAKYQEGRSISPSYLINFKNGNREELENRNFPSRLLLFNDGMGTVVRGIPHWLAFVQDNNNPHESLSNIFYFDLASKSLKTMYLPIREEDERSWVNCGLGVLDEQLTVTFINDIEFGAECEIWGMKEYGVMDSWTKLLSVSYTTTSHLRLLSPLGYLSNGDIILDMGEVSSEHFCFDNWLMAYNTMKKTFKPILPSFGRRVGPKRVPKVTYTPSLFSPC